MINKKALLSFACAALFSATAPAASDKDAIAAAEKALQTAASVGYEWRDTGKMIKQAKKLSSQGKSAEAIQLARQAEEQGRDAYMQYQEESKRFANTH